ncbi:MAG: DUF1549 domain-containing protein [Planctomycetaceae bacterium]|nr:DUF1549 domain-containing protein [Planctomycetaceae bacterium]
MNCVTFPRLTWALLTAGLIVLTRGNECSRAVGDDLPPAATTQVDFADEIQPLFEKHCLRCHGEAKQLSGFRLDHEGDALRGGDAGPAFEVGKSADSLLIKYVAGLDPDVVMPPEGDKLSSDEIGLLRAWIDQGAKWADAKPAAHDGRGRGHWSFLPIRRPAEPTVTNRDWPQSPLDKFVLARLESERIAPSPEADRRTLIRRLCLDLIGLPPTPDEVEQFVNDEGHDAYRILVDRLLASPHFGERWGRHWLDLARYADSDGYEKDSPRPHAWRYRHWLIEAVNRDLPFDQFTIEQLAGDLLPEATLDQQIATGFHRNTLTNTEGGVDKEEFRVAAVVDRVNTTASVWLGLTLGCAQCHSHKYDPLTLREYYGMFSFFNQGQEVDLSAPLPDESRAYTLAKTAYDAAHAPFTTAIAEFESSKLADRQAEWERMLDRSKFVSWKILEPKVIVVEPAVIPRVMIVNQPDQSILVGGGNPAWATYTVQFRTDLACITAFRLEVLPDPSIPAMGPGRAGHGNFVLSEFRVGAGAGDSPVTSVALQSAKADFSQQQYEIAGAIDGDPKTGWAVAPEFGKPHVALFETVEAIGGPDTVLRITLDQQFGSQHTIGRFRLSATAAKVPVPLDGLPDAIELVLSTPAEQRTPDQKRQLAAYFNSIDGELIKLRQAEAKHAKTAPTPPATKAQALVEVSQPRQTHIHLRGDFLRKGDEVPPHTPEVLPPLPSSGSHALNRLDLARWLVARENPLTPRVTVNRVWKHLFGQALVGTMDDFGVRGEKPSNPELLDWLASEFVAPSLSSGTAESAGEGRTDVGATPPGPPLLRGGDAAPPKGGDETPQPGRDATPWSLKRLIRMIVMSATYRQQSHSRAELIERDPKNLLLARQNRFRLEAEVLRDVSLATSGLLTSTVGGPSVRPRQPAGISELTYAGSAKWVESSGPDRHRRGLYTWFQRTSPYPMLMTFDAPESNVTCTRRERSNTPLQALTLLNDPVFYECAQALGRRMLAAHPDDVAARLQFGIELCLARPPTIAERERLKQLHDDLRSAAAADLPAAAKLVGDPKPANGQLAELAATVAVARIILNLDEFVTRE